MLQRLRQRLSEKLETLERDSFVKALQESIADVRAEGGGELKPSARRRLALLLERQRNSLGRFQTALTRAPNAIVSLFSITRVVVVGSLGFLAIFLLHQLVIWASVNPADAFERAKTLFAFIEILWDTTAHVLNALVDVINAIVPAWNVVAEHVIEPLVYIVLDVFFLIFLQRPYEGLISEGELSYKGFVCDPDVAASSQICGDFKWYYQALQSGEAAGTGVVNGSIVLSSQTGRRLSEAVTEPLVGTIDMNEVDGALSSLVSMTVVVVAQIADVVMHVLYVVASEVLTLILDAVLVLINTAMDILLMLVRSGLLETLLFLALDLFVIYFIEIQLPLLFMKLDTMLCLVNILFGQNTWDLQLECIQGRCFKEGGVEWADPLVFSSVPVAWKLIHSVIQAAVYSKTGRTLFGDLELPTSGAWLPENIPALQADGCSACFVCKIPEFRLLAFLVMSAVGCVNPGYANQYYGTVERDCAVNGSFYTAMCGPRESSFMSDSQWAATYVLHREYDAEHVQLLASRASERAGQLGGSGGSEDGFVLDQIAQAWFLRDLTLPEEDQSAAFHRRVCSAMRGKRAQDGGPDFEIYPDASVERITSQFLYESCKKDASYMCYHPVGQSVQSFAYEVSICLRDRPSCLKRRETCLGTCSGDGEEMMQDFATTISKNELSPDILQDSFHRARANCSVKSKILYVPFFGGGENFRAFSSRLRVRGGFTGKKTRSNPSP